MRGFWDEAGFCHAGKGIDLQAKKGAVGFQTVIYAGISSCVAAAIDSAQAWGATALNIVASQLFYANRHLIMQRATAAQLSKK